jgi:hypothetical protein
MPQFQCPSREIETKNGAELQARKNTISSSFFQFSKHQILTQTQSFFTLTPSPKSQEEESTLG